MWHQLAWETKSNDPIQMPTKQTQERQHGDDSRHKRSRCLEHLLAKGALKSLANNKQRRCQEPKAAIVVGAGK